MTQPVSASSSNYYLPGENEAVQEQKGLADPDAFMKILVAQLRYQNPMEPQDSAQFVSQMSQMASMEQMYKVSQSMDKMAAEYEMSRYFQLIGQQVSVIDGEDVITGRVGGVYILDEPYFYMAGDDTYVYTLDQLVDVAGNPNDNSLLAYMSLVGQRVTVKDDSSDITGIVEKVLLEDGNVMVSIDGSNYNLGQIIKLHGRPEEHTDQDPGDSGDSDDSGENPAGGDGTGEE